MLAPEVAQRTMSKLYYNSTVPIPCNIALRAIERFATAANRLVRIEMTQTSTVELVTLLTDEIEAAMFMPNEETHRDRGGTWFRRSRQQMEPEEQPVQPRIVPRRTGSSTVSNSTEYVDVPVDPDVEFDEKYKIIYM